MRRLFIAGNWKMHKSTIEAIEYAEFFTERVKDVEDVDMVICAPSTMLEALKGEFEGSNVALAAQNMHYEEKGAFTGEISPSMVKEFATHVIIGHSERRNIFGESNGMINKKILSALKHELNVIFCIGEKFDEMAISHKIIETQLRSGLNGVKDISKIVIAYEPVWAIGTGKTATPDYAEKMHKFIRSVLENMYSKKVADVTRIIYGGSVKPDNAGALLKMENIDGALPGGASLDPDKLYEIIMSK